MTEERQRPNPSLDVQSKVNGGFRSLSLLRHPAFWPAVVFLLTLATHGYYLVEMAGHPLFNFPLVDSKTYHLQALDLLGNGWLGRKVFWQAPFYPYFLAACYSFIEEKARFFDVRVIQAVIAALNAVLLYRFGRRKLGHGVGFGAAVAAAFYGPLIYYDAEMLAPVLIVFFYLLLALTLDRAFEAGKIGWWPVAGALNSLAALSHGLGLLIAPFVCLYGLWGRLMRPMALRPRLMAVALFISGAAVVVAPVTLRNRLVGGEWVLISHNGPINFYIGNHPDYDRMVGLRPGLEWQTLARDLTQDESASVQKSSRRYTRDTLENIRRHPAAVARVWLKKVRLFFRADEIKRDYPIYPVREYSPFLRALMWVWPGPGGVLGLGFPFGVVLPLAAMGWWVLRRQGRRIAALELILIGHFSANLLFFICSRYRIPIAPFLLLYAAAGVDHLVRRKIWQFASLRRNWAAVPVVIVVFLFSNAYLSPMVNRTDRAEYRFFLALASERNDPQKALEYCQTALFDDPELTDAHYFLGVLLQNRFGESAKALDQFNWVLERDPDNMAVLYNKAIVLAALGHWEEAREILKALVVNDPENEQYRKGLEHVSEKATRMPSESRTSPVSAR